MMGAHAIPDRMESWDGPIDTGEVPVSEIVQRPRITNQPDDDDVELDVQWLLV